MFKRVVKKQAKRERDEELGLDNDAKQILGMHDTDTDESTNSDSDSDDDNDLDRGGGMQTEWLQAGDDETDGEDDGDDDDDDDLLEGEPPLTISEAVKNPIYLISDDSRKCIVCPAKKLQSEREAESHARSKGHRRRFSRFCSAIEEKKSLSSDDPRKVVADFVDVEQVAPFIGSDGLSVRAAKRKWKLEMLKDMRRSKKEIRDIVKARREKAKAKLSPDTEATQRPDDNEGATTKSADDRPKKKRKTSKVGDEIHGSDDASKSKSGGARQAKRKSKDKKGSSVEKPRYFDEAIGKSDAGWKRRGPRKEKLNIDSDHSRSLGKKKRVKERKQEKGLAIVD